MGVDLWGGQVRGASENRSTAIRPAAVPRIEREMRSLFCGAYARFASACRAVDEPGIAMIAVDEATGRPAGCCTLRARVARHVAAIVGRHDQCDLFLNGNDELALRHLAIVLDPVKSWSKNSNGVTYRVLDLRTSNSFRDEHGRPLRGLKAEGAAVLRVGGYALFVVPLGDAADWPESANDAWDMIPPREYFDELTSTPESSIKIPQQHSRAFERSFAGARTHVSMIMRTAGPRDSSASLVAPGSGVGSLELVGKSHRGTLSLGHSAMRDGILIGRYARCDGAGLLDDPSLSRVHALLLDVEDAFLVIDTASRNGTRIAGQASTRVVAISGDLELGLGSRTRAFWRFCS